MPRPSRSLRHSIWRRSSGPNRRPSPAVASDLSFEAFRANVVALLDPTATPEPTKAPEPTTKPKPEPTVVAVKNPAPNDFEIFFKKCVDSRDLRSDPGEFRAKVEAKVGAFH